MWQLSSRTWRLFWGAEGTTICFAFRLNGDILFRPYFNRGDVLEGGRRAPKPFFFSRLADERDVGGLGIRQPSTRWRRPQQRHPRGRRFSNAVHHDAPAHAESHHHSHLRGDRRSHHLPALQSGQVGRGRGGGGTFGSTGTDFAKAGQLSSSSTFHTRQLDVRHTTKSTTSKIIYKRNSSHLKGKEWTKLFKSKQREDIKSGFQMCVAPFDPPHPQALNVIF